MRLIAAAFGIVAVAGCIAIPPSAQALPMPCNLVAPGTPGCGPSTAQPSAAAPAAPPPAQAAPPPAPVQAAPPPAAAPPAAPPSIMCPLGSNCVANGPVGSNGEGEALPAAPAAAPPAPNSLGGGANAVAGAVPGMLDPGAAPPIVPGPQVADNGVPPPPPIGPVSAAPGTPCPFQQGCLTADQIANATPGSDAWQSQMAHPGQPVPADLRTNDCLMCNPSQYNLNGRGHTNVLNGNAE